MILSKANLLPIGLVKKEGDARLNTLHITKEGSTVAINSNGLIAVSPVAQEVRKSLKFYADKEITGNNQGTITAETVKNVLKYMPKDILYKGLLEHTDFNQGEFKINDGKRTHSVKGNIFSRKYIDYKKFLKTVGAEKEETKVTLNLKTLLLTLNNLDKITQNTTNDNPVYLTITEKGHLIFRSENYRTNQRVIAVTKSYKGEEETWLKMNFWEKKILGKLEGIVKKILVKKKSVK